MGVRHQRVAPASWMEGASGACSSLLCNHPAEPITAMTAPQYVLLLVMASAPVSAADVRSVVRVTPVGARTYFWYVIHTTSHIKHKHSVIAI
jgi:hypothetical protein